MFFQKCKTLLEYTANHCSDFIRKASIKNRLLFAFLITSVLPTIFVGLFANHVYKESTYLKVYSYSSELLNQVSQNSDNILTEYETLSENIMMNDLLQSTLLHFDELDDMEKYNYYQQFTDVMNVEFFRMNSNLQNIHIRTLDGQVFYDLGFERYRESQISHILEATKSSQSNQYWTLLETTGGTNYLVLSRFINSKSYPHEKIGYLLITINEKIFAQKIYENINLGEGSKIFVASEEGIVLSSVTDEIPIGKSIPWSGELTNGMDVQMQMVSFTGEDYLLVESNIDVANWHLVGMIPSAYIHSESSGVTKGVILSSAIVVLLSIVLSLLIYLSVFLPFRSLLDYTEKISAGNLDLSIVDTHKDEMGLLARNINNMVQQLKFLIEKVKKEQKLKRQTELQMLQAQINPHFLFNTLNSLKWTAMLSGNRTLNDGLESLSVLLKNTLTDQEEVITLKNELDNLHHYATIQRIRYGDSFVLNTQVAEGLENKYYILKFLLQPIVENSIIHGTAGKRPQITIQVRVTKEEGKLKVTITDNGVGYDPQQKKNIKGEINNGFSGIGIKNVQQRIQMNYGTLYDLSTCSQPGEGTKTVIWLPLLTLTKGGN